MRADGGGGSPACEQPNYGRPGLAWLGLACSALSVLPNHRLGGGRGHGLGEGRWGGGGSGGEKLEGYVGVVRVVVGVRQAFVGSGFGKAYEAFTICLYVVALRLGMAVALCEALELSNYVITSSWYMIL